MHRKVHLFDIDIPGKITFKVGVTQCHLNFPQRHADIVWHAQESETLSAGSSINQFDTGMWLCAPIVMCNGADRDGRLCAHRSRDLL